MKTNKTKSARKEEKKAVKRIAKKELEASVSDKFMEAIRSLGHDAGKIGKDIKKAGKQVAKKLAEKMKDFKTSADSSIETTGKKGKIKGAKKPLTSPKLGAAVAPAEEKEAALASAPVKRKYTRRAVSADAGAKPAAKRGRAAATAGSTASRTTRKPATTRTVRSPKITGTIPPDANAATEQNSNHSAFETRTEETQTTETNNSPE